MTHDNSDSAYQKPGRVCSWSVFVLGLIYAITTFLGFLSLKSPDEQIGNPYFTIMELLSILIAPLMTISLIAVHYHASPAGKIYSLTAFIFMTIMTGITSGVHFIILTAGQQIKALEIPNASFFFSFRWPSVLYALDILAWDWFFALSILFAAPVFKRGRLEKILSYLMILSGVLSLAGLIGIPLQSMHIRNIGIIGYAILGPVIFLMIGIVLARPK
jgi:hypothetical protein